MVAFLEKGLHDGDRVMIAATAGGRLVDDHDAGRTRGPRRHPAGARGAALRHLGLRPHDGLRGHARLPVLRPPDVPPRPGALRALRGQDRRQGRPAGRGRGHRDPRPDRPLRRQQGGRDLPRGEDEEPVHLRVHRARDEAPRRHPRPQGGPARLRGLRLRSGRARVPAGRGGGAPRQRRPLLHRHARARRHARLLQRPVRRADRREERPRRDRRHDPGVRGGGQPGPRHRRVHGREDERPRDRHRAHRPGVPELLPARLLAGRHPPRRALPEDRGAGAPARGDRARPPGLLRPLRHRGHGGGEEPRAGRTPRSSTGSTPPPRSTGSPSA